MPRPSFALALFLLGLAVLSTPAFAQPALTEARARVEAAVEAMGGADALRNVHTVRLAAEGHRNLLEQSERFEGPYIPAYEHTEELVDLERGAYRLAQENRTFGFASTLTVADGVAQQTVGERSGPARPMDLGEARERLALGPERVLLTAVAAPDLRAEADAALQGVPHHVVAFTWEGRAVRLFLNAHTGLPTAVETVEAYPEDVMWNVWGDVTRRVLFSFWTLEPGGVLYPHQWDELRNGVPYRVRALSEVTLNAPAADSFAVADDVREAFAQRPAWSMDDLPLGRPDREPEELAPGLVHVPGPWDVTLVRQDDGVVLLEAPISNGYTAQALAEAARRFPGAPVRAAVTTSDAWPHAGGVRAVVARGLPLYALDTNEAFLRALLDAPHTLRPDSLARAPRAADLRLVAEATTVGEGANRLVLYPVRGESGERMMVAYFPAHRLLYASDLVQKQPDGSFWQPAYLQEVTDLVTREGLVVERVFAMHMDAVPWQDVLDAVAAAKAGA